MRRDPRAYLWDIQQGCLNVQSFLHGISLAKYQSNLLLRSAVERQLQNIGEALAQLTKLGACRAWGVDSEKRLQRGQFLPDLQAHSSTMGQKAGVLGERRSQKWAAEAAS